MTQCRQSEKAENFSRKSGCSLQVFTRLRRHGVHVANGANTCQPLILKCLTFAKSALIVHSVAASNAITYFLLSVQFLFDFAILPQTRKTTERKNRFRTLLRRASTRVLFGLFANLGAEAALAPAPLAMTQPSAHCRNRARSGNAAVAARAEDIGARAQFPELFDD